MPRKPNYERIIIEITLLSTDIFLNQKRIIELYLKLPDGYKQLADTEIRRNNTSYKNRMANRKGLKKTNTAYDGSS